MPRTLSTLNASLATLLGSTALLAAGCGDDSDSDTERQATAVAPTRAVAEIAAVRAGLRAGLVAYRAGDGGRADELIGDAYLEHFELVEGPLEARDEELNEELELLISTEIRREIKQGARVAQVERLVAQANAELDQAEKALQGG